MIEGASTIKHFSSAMQANKSKWKKKKKKKKKKKFLLGGWKVECNRPESTLSSDVEQMVQTTSARRCNFTAMLNYRELSVVSKIETQKNIGEKIHPMCKNHLSQLDFPSTSSWLFTQHYHFIAMLPQRSFGVQNVDSSRGTHYGRICTISPLD